MEQIVIDVLTDRYFQPGEESWADISKRVSEYVGKKVEEKKLFYNLIRDRIFIPNSPCLMNAGTINPQMSACFTIPIGDSIPEIFDAIKYAAIIHKSGGGCIGGESLLITSNGPKTIKEYVESDDDSYVYSYDENTKSMKWANVIKKHTTSLPSHRIYNIKGHHGFSIRASDWHPFFVFDGLDIVHKRADELQKGDCIIGSNDLCNPITFVDKGYLLGVVISDGAIDKTSRNSKYIYDRVRILKSHESVIAKCAEIIDCKYSISKREDYQVACYELSVSGAKASYILGLFDTDSVKCNNKHIPTWVFTSDISMRMSVLIGLLDGDGFQEKNTYAYDTCSKDLAYGLHMLLGTIGIPSKMRTKVSKKEHWSLMYSVTFENSTWLNNIINEMSMRHNYDLKTKNCSISVDKQYFYDLDKIIKIRTVESSKHGIEIDNAHVNTAKWGWSGLLPKNSTAIVLRKLGYDKNAASINSGIKIEKIEVSSYDDTLYDLTVENSHTYVAGVNGFCIVHNTGFNFSDLRAKGSVVQGTGHIASGPVSFLKVFNEATETIKQGGKRRGANLGSLDVDHPDIVEFITCKNMEGSLSNFNISVNIPDSFMKNLSDPHNKKIWDLIVDGNWKNGEPGIIFSDRAELDNTCKHLGKVKYRNPCAEFVGLAWESCNLGSINLTKFVNNGVFDYDKFNEVIILAVTFLNNVIDKNEYPLPQIQEATLKTRKIGLGVMGLADTFILMNLTYGSKESLKFTSNLFKTMRSVADEASISLASKHGVYPESQGDQRRNASVLSIAPTGTISLIAECSSSIEPNFSYVTNRSTWASGEKQTYIMIHPLFNDHLSDMDETTRQSIISYMHENKSIQNCDDAPAELKRLFITASDISPAQHVAIQSVIQKHVDQSISKTINCSNDTTKEQIANIMLDAWRSGCKGITVYRDGSRDNVVLEGKSEVKSNLGPTYKVPSKAPAIRYNVRVGCGKMAVFVVGDPDTGEPIELWQIPVSGGGCAGLNSGNGRGISKALQYGMPPEVFIKSGEHVTCPACAGKPNLDGKSCPSAAGRKLREYINDIKVVKKYLKAHHEDIELLVGKHPIEQIDPPLNDNRCPSCKEPLTFAEGCATCQKCGYSKCS